MKGVTEFTIGVVVGVLLLVFTLFIFVNGFNVSNSGFDVTKDKETVTPPTCPDCATNADGARCIKLYDEGIYKLPFCGCYTKEDCTSEINVVTRIGVCNENNICK
jgi:hypothetical protein